MPAPSWPPLNPFDSSCIDQHELRIHSSNTILAHQATIRQGQGAQPTLSHQQPKENEEGLAPDPRRIVEGEPALLEIIVSNG